MSLSNEQIRTISTEAANKIILKGRCTDRANYFNDMLEDQVDFKNAIAPLEFKPRKGAEEIIFYMDSHINLLREDFPQSSLNTDIVNKMQKIRDKVNQMDKKNVRVIATEVDQGLRQIREEIFDKMLKDFAACQCEA